MPKDSLGTHQAAEETGTSVGEVIIPFRTVLGLELIGCWRNMQCHFTKKGSSCAGSGCSGGRLCSVCLELEARQQVLMRMLYGRRSNDDVAESRDSPLVAF
ncbi:BQ5605_C029g10602 [Microbotryum silenes-dioicae]|uniref:BQ5605_C029g10602 protein n=1 Tax=Microbotryum silenes-dioicae TaxID=796604 RepID=A0A2X0MLL5_9BASI|nr:BQ5605_C029g10602 [Microbotryum silenes-dioicae]